ncbi:gamma-glutamyl-gamma-aminobutyrate hydrolase family protein, partial [uncultured Dubosiella sp.]
MKPVIGIAAQILKDTTDQFIGQEYIRLNEDYIRAVTKAGGIPMVLADLPAEDLKVLIRYCDGLILSGGWDIDPLLFGEN